VEIGVSPFVETGEVKSHAVRLREVVEEMTALVLMLPKPEWSLLIMNFLKGVIEK